MEDELALPPPLPREIVKNTTSSKKADVPPAKADPARARKPKKGPTGNEAALKTKVNNKEVAAPGSTPSNKEHKKAFDRHSRTGKTDSKKKLKQGWGSNDKRELDDETNATGDALAELEKDAAEKGEPAAPAAKSLQDYLNELQLAENQLGGKRTVRSANEGAEDKWTAGEKVEKHTEAFVKPTAGKKQKQKATKEKKFLDFNAVFADEAPRAQNDAPRGGFKGSRGGKPARGGARAGNGKKAQPPAVNDQNFPSLK